MTPKDYEVIYKITVAQTVHFPSALNWNAEPVGELIRCKDCKFHYDDMPACKKRIGAWFDDDYCNGAVRAERIEE